MLLSLLHNDIIINTPTIIRDAGNSFLYSVRKQNLIAGVGSQPILSCAKEGCCTDGWVGALDEVMRERKVE